MLIDLLKYRLRIDRYGNDPYKNHMSAGFDSGIPQSVIEQLDVGDMIFTQKRNSILSWGVMYFTKSDCDHCVLYAGDNKIMHMTLGGMRHSRIDVLFNNTLLLPIKLTMPDGGPPYGMREPDRDYATEERKSPIPKFKHVKHSQAAAKFRLVLAGIKIHLGFDPSIFRWSMLIDNVLVASLLALTLYFTVPSIWKWLPIGLISAFPFVMVGSHFALSKLGVSFRRGTRLEREKWNLLRHGALAVYDINRVPRAWINAIYRRD